MLAVIRQVLHLLAIVLVVDEVRDDIGLSDVDEEAVSNDDGAVKLGKGAIALSKVLDLVLSIDGVELNVELSALVVVGRATHHRIHRRLLLRGVGVVRIVGRDDEVVHLLLEHLFARGVLDESTSSSSSILRVVIAAFGAILNSKVGVAIELLPSRAGLIARDGLTCSEIGLGWHDTHRIDQQGEVLLEVSRTEDLELESWHVSLLHDLVQHALSSLLSVAVEDHVVLDLFGLKDIEVLFHGLGLHLHLVLWLILSIGVADSRTSHSVRVIRAPVGGSLQVLRVIGVVSLVEAAEPVLIGRAQVSGPLLSLLALYHVFHLILHGLSQLTRGVQRSIVPRV